MPLRFCSWVLAFDSSLIFTELTSYEAHASSSSLLGHLLVAKDVMSKPPSNAHPQYLPGQVRRKYPDVGPVFYLDMRPFSLPILVVASP